MNKKALLTIGLIALGLILVTAVTQYGQANWMGHGGMMSGMNTNKCARI